MFWPVIGSVEQGVLGSVLGTDPDVGLSSQAVGLVLVLLDLARDLRHLPPLAEVDQLLPRPPQEVGVPLLRLQDVGQVDPCSAPHKPAEIQYLYSHILYTT